MTQYQYDKINTTEYSSDYVSSTTYTRTLPQKSGTFAMLDDIPTSGGGGGMHCYNFVAMGYDGFIGDGNSKYEIWGISFDIYDERDNLTLNSLYDEGIINEYMDGQYMGYCFGMDIETERMIYYPLVAVPHFWDNVGDVLTLWVQVWICDEEHSISIDAPSDTHWDENGFGMEFEKRW
jgi:hypothetical protein